MMRLLSSFSTLLFITFAGFFLFMAWHASGWSGTFKMLYLVALVPLAGLAVTWICRGIFWAVAIVLASIYMSIEFVVKQLLKLVFWK
ncbi:hypothetical protein FCL47_23640 [Desulfopila sp. IMCC35006]|uniref:hypothetical protein n=1 Tax=Desulfopila sp. IMCC35006 TaxID=2569542 RepID=UPI0010ABA5B0|nr:hypothetical protein [Desulfopila sp. IMCC35006]TKB23150.1 hypothetical protein FCL47_23640 [Desulfopila sp. IMCC35006]